MKNYINYIKHINENNDNVLKYHIFDWDDNLLLMDTKILCQQNINNEWVDVKISTKKLVEIKTKYEKYWDNDDYTDVFVTRQT